MRSPFCLVATSLSLALASLAIGTPAAAEEPNGPAREEARQHAQRGQQYFEQGRLEEAEKEFLAAAQADPTWRDNDYNLSVVYDAEGRMPEAAAALRAYLPFAAPDERAALEHKLAQLEIAAADAARRDEAARKEAERSRREAVDADHRRQVDEAKAAEQKAMARRTLTLHCDDGCEGVSVTPERGKAFICLEPATTCAVHVPPGLAHVVWTHGRKKDIQVPDGPATVTEAGTSGPAFLVLLGAAGIAGSVGLLITSKGTPNAQLVGGSILGGASVLSFIVGLSLDSYSLVVTPARNSAVERRRLERSRFVALGPAGVWGQF